MSFILFTKNVVRFGIGNAAMRATSFLLIPLYTYYLSVEDYGRIETMFITIQILVIFMGFGISDSVVRFYRASNNRGNLTEFLGSSLIILLSSIFLIAVVFVTILGPFFKALIGYGTESIFVFLVCFIASINCIAYFLMSICRAQNDATRFAWMGILHALLTILLTVLLLCCLNLSLKGALFARIIASGIIGIILALSLSMLLSFRLSRKRLHELLPFSFPIVFVAAGFFILNASDRYFLAHFVGMNEVAIYALGYKLTFILLHFIIIPIDLAYAPYVFDHLNDPDIKKKMAQIFTLSILLITLVGSAILFVSEDLIRLIAPADFNSSYAVTFCIMPVVAFTGILYWAAVLIHISKKTYIIGVTITVSSILNLWLNYMLIPRFGWKGAVISTNGSYLLAVIVIFCVGMHLYKVKLELKRLAIIISAVVSLFVIYYFLNQANRIIYYGGVGLSYFLIFGVFHQISFFNRAERSLISSIFNR